MTIQVPKGSNSFGTLVVHWERVKIVVEVAPGCENLSVFGK